MSLHILPFLSQFFSRCEKKPYTESETGHLIWEKPWQASKWFTLFMTDQWGTGKTTQICEDSPFSGLQLGNKQALYGGQVTAGKAKDGLSTELNG